MKQLPHLDRRFASRLRTIVLKMNRGTDSEVHCGLLEPPQPRSGEPQN